MNFSLRTLFTVMLFTAVLFAVVASRYAPVELRLGMSSTKVESLLNYVGADNISDEMSNYFLTSYPRMTTAEEPADLTHSFIDDTPELGYNGITFWHLPNLNVTIGMVFSNEKLIQIDVWDLTGREMHAYDLLEYDSVTSLEIPLMHASYRTEMLKKHNPGANPPIRNGG